MRYSPHPQVANVDIFPDDFYVGDVYLDTQPTYRQWIAGEALRLCNASFWLSRGANDTQADDIEQTFIEIVRRILENTMPTPIGQIISTISLLDDSNWLLMDGSIYQRDDYQELEAVIPAHWKFEALFALPNMSQTFLTGAVYDGSPDIASYGIGRMAGEKRVTLGVNEMPVHSHGFGGGTSFVNGQPVGGTLFNPTGATRGTSSPATANAGGGQSHNNMPPSLAVYFYIRAR
jgi:microcystin-dependent protein